jgi:hypothetical protein
MSLTMPQGTKRLAAKAKRQFLANDNEPEQAKVRARKKSESDWD